MSTQKLHVHEEHLRLPYRPAVVAEMNHLRDWIRDVSEWGMPRFGELGCRLKLLRLHLEEDLRAQDVAAAALRAAPRPAPSVTGGFAKQLQRLCDQLDSLIARLNAHEPEFDSWQTAVHETLDMLDEADRLETEGPEGTDQPKPRKVKNHSRASDSGK